MSIPVYVTKLEEAGLKIHGEYLGATTKHHDLECLNCGIIFNANPKSKIRNFVVSGKRGCPKCIDAQRYVGSRENYIKEIEEKFGILSTIQFETLNNQTKIEVRNKNCQHVFQCTIVNLLYRHVNCPICNIRKN